MKKIPPNGMIKLADAAKLMGKRYDYVYGTHFLLWKPLLGIIKHEKHYYCNKDKTMYVVGLIKNGYIPSFKSQQGKDVICNTSLYSIIEAGNIEWIKTEENL